jgi:sialidase-1
VTSGAEEPVERVEPEGIEDDAVSEPTARAKRSRWLSRLWTPLVILFVAVGSVTLLFGWSIAEHERRLADAAEVDESGLAKELVFSADEDGYNLFRSPAIIRTEEGNVLAFAEGRRGEDDWTGVEAVVRRSEDSGETWLPLETVYEEEGVAIGSPTPVVDEETGTIWVALRKSLAKEPHETSLLLTHSTDDGETWSEPMDMTDKAPHPEALSLKEDMLPGPGHGIQLRFGEHAGRLLIPTTAGRDSTKSLKAREVFAAQALISDDHGLSWRYGGTTDYGGENTIAEWRDGTLYMFLRSRGWPEERGRKRYTVSHDGGDSWEPTILTDTLKEPVCHAKLLYHDSGGPDGEPAFFFLQPDVNAEGRWDKAARRKLTMFVSTDSSTSWPIYRVVHESTASYSDLELVDEHNMVAVFEVGVEGGKAWGGQIMTARVPLSWVLEGTGYEPPQPFSEDVFAVYTAARAPIEEWWKE